MCNNISFLMIKGVATIRKSIGREMKIYLPQENESINDKSQYADSIMIANGNQEKIKALDEVAESQFSYINLYVVGLVKNRGKNENFMLSS